MNVYKLVTAFIINRGYIHLQWKKNFNVWGIEFLRKVRYGTDSKQGDDLYDLGNAWKGRMAVFQPRKRTALGLRSSEFWGMRASKLLPVPFKQLTPKLLINVSRNDLQQVNNWEKKCWFLFTFPSVQIH